MTVNGSVIPPIDPNSAPDKRHGGDKTMTELLTKKTYTDNSWLFNDSVPIAGPRYQDGGYPKLRGWAHQKTR
jgi:hypothetical protein